jgi:hypothetical protein
MTDPITFSLREVWSFPLVKERIATLADKDGKVGVIKFDPPLPPDKAMAFTVAVQGEFGARSVVFIPEPQQWICRREMLEESPGA